MFKFSGEVAVRKSSMFKVMGGSAGASAMFKVMAGGEGQGRIQDLQKEGAQGDRRLVPKIFSANLEFFLKNCRKKGWACAPCAPPLWISA